MKTNRWLIIIICVVQTACQMTATQTMQASPATESPIATFLPTLTVQPTATTAVKITSTPNSTMGNWNELQYDTRKWTVITYNDTRWTPQTYPVHTLEPILIHKLIENCIVYLEEGRGTNLTYKEVPVIIGGHTIFDERIFMDENGQELFMVIVGSYHVDFPQNESKSQCIKDAGRVVMTGMGPNCPSGNCGHCPGLPRTNLKIGDMVRLFNSEMALPVTEPGGNQFVGNGNDWYLSDYNIEVINGPVCLYDNAWWQLRNLNGITGWDSDDHFVIQP